MEKAKPKSKKKPKKSIWSNSTKILVDLEKHNWNDMYEEWLAKWDEIYGGPITITGKNSETKPGKF